MFPELASQVNSVSRLWVCEQKPFTYVGAILSLAGVIQIRGRLWGFVLLPGAPWRECLDSTVVWVVITINHSFLKWRPVSLHIPVGLWERHLQSRERRASWLGQWEKFDEAGDWVPKCGKKQFLLKPDTKCTKLKFLTCFLDQHTIAPAALHNLKWSSILVQLLHSCSH